MKELRNIGAPLVINTDRNPLSVNFQIVPVGGQPMTQAEDTTMNIFLPDRESESPLILEPMLSVIDEKTGISYAGTADFKWYVGTLTNSWDPASETGIVAETLTPSSHYYLEKSDGVATGKLVVRKNVHYLSPVTIYCVVRFTDSASILHVFEESILLTSENKSEDYYEVNINAPSPVVYNPFSGTTSQRVLSATVTKGKYMLEGSKLDAIRYFWYLDNKLADTSNSAYVSGQGTDTLTVDAEYGDMLSIKVRIADTSKDGYDNEPNILTMDERILVWEYPEIDVTPYSTSGASVRNAEGIREFLTLVKVKGLDVAEEKWKEYLRMKWSSKDMSSPVETHRGWGPSIEIKNSDLFKKDTEVKVSVYTLGPLEPVTYNGEPVTMNGNTVYSRR